MSDVTISIDHGTVLLVAEILRKQRGSKTPPIADAKAAIAQAVKDLKPQSVS